MGDYADMMIDGTLCENCGEFIGEPCGYPRYCCPECAKDAGMEWEDEEDEEEEEEDRLT